MIHIVKGFGIVNKAEIDVFLELSCFFDDPAGVGNLFSGSSAFSKTSLNIWKFTVQVSLKPGLNDFEHYFTSVWDECSCAVVWAFFGIAFLWDWNVCVYIHTHVCVCIHIYIKSAFCLSTQLGHALFTSLPHFQEEINKFVFCVLLEDHNSMLLALHCKCLFQVLP